MQFERFLPIERLRANDCCLSMKKTMEYIDVVPG